MTKTIKCYRPLAQAELNLVKTLDYQAWPPRLPGQPFFYPVTNELYATELTQWNINDFGVGYVALFEVDAEYLASFPIKCVGATHHTEWWITAEELNKFNQHIIGNIQIIAKFTNSEKNE